MRFYFPICLYRETIVYLKGIYLFAEEITKLSRKYFIDKKEVAQGWQNLLNVSALEVLQLVAADFFVSN
jgi:hypothetical protein